MFWGDWKLDLWRVGQIVYEVDGCDGAFVDREFSYCCAVVLEEYKGERVLE